MILVSNKWTVTDKKDGTKSKRNQLLLNYRKLLKVARPLAFAAGTDTWMIHLHTVSDYSYICCSRSLAYTYLKYALSVQSVHLWPARMPSGVWWSPWRPFWSDLVACRPILIAKRLSARRSSLASAAVCETFQAWPPTRDSQGGWYLGNLVTNGPSQ